MKLAYSFVRWSTKLQGDEGRDSLRRQVRSTQEWCQRNGYELSKEVFIGAGESGYHGAHMKKNKKTGEAIGALARFIEKVEMGDIPEGSLLCFDSVDRFGRMKVTEATELFLRLINLGIGIVFTGSYLQQVLTKDFVDKNPDSLSMLINESIRSWRESDERSRKIKSAKQLKLQEIKSGKIVPHNNTPKYFTFNHDKKRYEFNAKVKTVKRIVDEYLSGKSLYSIAKGLNDEKISAIKVDTQWSARTVKNVLTNKALIGEFLGTKEFFPSLIDESTFKKIQNILKQNEGNRGILSENVNIFRGLCFCSGCKKAMYILSQSKDYRQKVDWKRPYNYLRCGQISRGRSCTNSRCIRLEDMELEFFMNCLTNDPRNLVSNGNDAETKAIKTRIIEHQTRINEISNKITALIKAASVPEVADEIQKLNEQRENETRLLDDANLELSKVESTPTQFDDLKKILGEFNAHVPTPTKDGVDIGEQGLNFDKAVKRLAETLKDTEVRMKLRTILPTLIGKIVVDTTNETFTVYNRQGKPIYKAIEV